MNPTTIRALVGVAILAVAFAGGWMVNGWRLDGNHQEAIAEKQHEIELRDESIREQNKGVEAARAATASADERRKVAEKYAAGILKTLDVQSAAVAGSKQTTCAGVLHEAWETWK